MRISFNHEEVRKGLIFGKTYAAVTVTVQFSEEELYVIRQQRLQEHIVLEREPEAHEPQNEQTAEFARNGLYHLRVKNLMKPNTYVCRTNADAKIYEEDLTEALKKMKRFIEASSSKAESKTIEL